MTTTETTKAKAVCYLRVSTKDQAERGDAAEGFSIPAQREACLRQAESLDAVIVEEFVDRGESARSAARPELQRMLTYLSENPTSVVIVHKIDRLARNRADDVGITLAIKKSGAALVSCTENIDETPSGLLLHGIMSSIAEFYSQNLAAEVKKGSLQKAKSGGTPGRAPIGYVNVRKVVNGREERTIEIDPVRGPLMQYAFERYAMGNINLRDLLQDLTERGLDSRPGPRSPSKPITLSHFHRLITHPYYKGLVLYKGVTYPGNHQPLVDVNTWQKVQDVLASRSSQGKKDRKHNHYLKGAVWCGQCGGRLIVSHNKGRQGKIYPYFICVERQKKRRSCDQRAVRIELVEQLIEEHYWKLQLIEGEPGRLRHEIRAELQDSYEEVARESATQERRQRELLDEQAKLLQAHYADAIPLELLKREQKRIEAELALCEQHAVTVRARFEDVERNLDKALQAAGRWAYAYGESDDLNRAAINDAVFEKIYIDNDGMVSSTLRPLFSELFRRSQQFGADDTIDVAGVELSRTLVESLTPVSGNSQRQLGWGVRENDLVGVEGPFGNPGFAQLLRRLHTLRI